MFWISMVLMICLGAYAAGYYLSMFVFVSHPGRAAPREFDAQPETAVAILIPARDEGERAVRVIHSLLRQDHPGEIEIYLLLKDDTDSALPFLRDAFSELRDVQVQLTAPSRVTILERSNRRVYVVFTGVAGKSEKINAVTSGIRAPYTAIIDCDHQAQPAWIRSSLCLLRERNAQFIQGRRGPLSAAGFFRLWDSLHQHIGCELFNTAFARLGLTVFFTGTTAVMSTKLLQDNPLHVCITEDADFSYQVVLAGAKILHNPYYGSDEEVSPDLFSFLARRRRWANGHTGTFFRHLPRMWSSPLRWRERMQFLYHGLHYLVAVPVAALHLLIGFYFLQNLAPVHAGAAAFGGLYLALRISASQKTATTKLFTRVLEVAALFAWFFPAAVIAVNLTLAVLANDAPRALPPVPYVWQIVGLICFAAPPLVLLAGLAGFRQLGAGTFGAVVVTYPVAFYLDIAGVLIGLTDLVAGWSPWHAVTRADEENPGENTGENAGAHANENTGEQNAPRVAGAGIRRNWRLRDVPAALPALARAMRRSLIRKSPADAKEPYTMKNFWKSFRWIVPLLVIAVVVAAVMYTPRARIPLAGNACTPREHDSHPWIIAPEKLPEYCEDVRDVANNPDARRFAGGTGTFRVVRNDRLQRVDPAFWEPLDSTFFCNLAQFRPENVSLIPDGGVQFDLLPVAFGDRKFTAGSLATKDSADARYLYGRFEVSLKPVRGAGVVTAFFLYRFDPWQEIDTEFLGDDTTKLLLNVFYNPGEPGDQYNYGFRGTPVVVDLGFDAALDYHTYALEWDPEEIRWFVDGVLVHSRSAGRPTPIPHLPMRFYMNVWPTCSAELAGAFDRSILPTAARFRSVKIYGYQPAAFPAYSNWIESFFSDTNGPRTWRDEAEWMQPRK